MKKIKEKEYALITGTTSGIGYELCEKFASKNINLILASRNEELLMSQKERLTQKYGIEVYYITLDLSLIDSAKKLADYVKSLNIPIDYLVNNAGFNEVGYFLNTDINKELSMIRLHTVFVTELTKYILPHMVKRKKGRILNFGSTGSFVPSPTDAVYCATKAYILFFSKALHGELRKTGVKVTVACPGATKSGFAQKAGIQSAPMFNTFVLSAKKVANKSFKAMKRGRRVKIVGFYGKFQVLFSKILPARFSDYLAVKIMKAK